MMRIIRYTFLLTLAISIIGSEEREAPRDDNRISSNCSCQNISDAGISEDDVVFKAYKRKNSTGILISINSTESELKSIFLQNVPTTFITHGWLGSEDGSYLADVRDAYLQKSDMNVIVVGWSKISRNEYVYTTFGVAGVGAVVGRMVSNLLTAGVVTLDHIHLVGHSLGAHVMGNAGSFLRDCGYGKVKRVTGLDPAKPGYEQISDVCVRLDSDDGQFVDIIHTSSGTFGYIGTLGHADFYPNGGYNQPGCSFSLNIFCSHLKAFEYFKDSIYNELAFPSMKCDSYSKYVGNECENQEVVYMGEPTPSSARGTFYLQTSNNETMD